MDTKIIKINPNNIDIQKIKEMGKIISDGGLVAFPTETVYGLGANAFSANSVRNIFHAKGRPADNPLIVHVSSFEEVKYVARDIPQKAKMIFEKFAPGPITVIMKKSPFLPDAVTAGLDTVAVRIPEHPVARALIKEAGVPIAAPSANSSGKPSPTKAEHVIHDMKGKIEAVIDGGVCRVGLESTVVDVTGKSPVILRPGGITYDELKELFPDVEIDMHILKAVDPKEVPKCPGMKYKHYAPDAEVYVVEGDKSETSAKIKELLKENKNKRTGVISLDKGNYLADKVLYAGCNNKEYANKLFDFLREFDKEKIDIVFAQFCYDDTYALAVKNRLYKSAANKIIRV